MPTFGARLVQLRSAGIARERFGYSRGRRIGGEWVGAGARSVCGVWVEPCACGVAGEAVVEDAGEAGVDLVVVEWRPAW